MAEPLPLIRAGALPGRLVVALQDGAILGLCRRAIEDPFLGRVLGFAFEDDEWYEGPKFIPQQAILEFGDSALLLRDRGEILELHQAAEMRLVLKQRESLVEKHVMTEGGKYLGEIFDYDFNAEGAIAHYFIHRYLAGESSAFAVPATRTVRVGKNLVLVADGAMLPTDLAPDPKQLYTHGPQAAITPTAKSLEALRRPKAGTLRTTSQSTARGKRQPSAAERFNQRQYAYLLGRRCERDITADDGSLLVACGQLIDEPAIESAQAAGKFMELAISSRTGPTLSGNTAA